MPFKKKIKQSMLSPEDEANYQKVVRELKALIDDLRAKGIDPFPRMDFLECRACGAYEDESFSGLRFIAGKNGLPVREGLDIFIHPKKYPRSAGEKLIEGLSEEEAEAKMRAITSPESFILIDQKEIPARCGKNASPGGQEYTFICSICGAQQIQFVEDE